MLEEQMKKVSDSYRLRTQKEEQMRKGVWQGYSCEVRDLTYLVSQEFKKVLSEIGPLKSSNEYIKGKSRILEFNINYHVYENSESLFSIHINRFENKGQIFKDHDGKCPHCYIDLVTGFGSELHPKIKKFKEDYHINHISEPENECEHK